MAVFPDGPWSDAAENKSNHGVLLDVLAMLLGVMFNDTYSLRVYRLNKCEHSFGRETII